MSARREAAARKAPEREPRPDSPEAPDPHAAPAPREVRVELLVGKVVHDAAGEKVGRLEEIVVELDGADYVVREFHVGAYAAFERLAGGPLRRTLLHTLSGGRLRRGYVVDWRDMDLGDPERPRVRKRKGELRKMDG